MSSDISRLIFEQHKHYSGVRLQQGRVLLDSDWNAQEDIHQHRRHIQTIDIIGKTGVPIDSNGFELRQNDGVWNLSPGRMYVEGLLCELDRDIELTPGQDALLVQNPDDGLPYALIDSVPDEGNFVVYIVAWQREVSYLQDPAIREKALGDPDTTTRLQTVWQMKFGEVASDSSCDDVNVSEIEPMSTGEMEARTVSAEVSENPCDFNETSGYRRLENQLYRIEIQKGGTRARSRFKWSRDNASVRANVTEITGSNSAKLHTLGRDDVLGFRIGDWVEFISHNSSLNRLSGLLAQIEDIDVGSKEITVNSNLNDLGEEGLQLVRWDQQSENLSLSTSFVDIEEGIQVRFKNGNYRIGDYWLIPARTIDSSIEWPLGNFRRPSGIRTALAKIAIVEASPNGIQSVQDCRLLFPPLTDLPKGSKGCSTYHVTAETGWERIFSRIKDGENAKICFGVGTFNLGSTVDIKGKGHLVITGCGNGTIIQASKLQVAFRFDGCASVDVSQLKIITNVVRNRNKEDVVSLKGGLTFVNSGKVQVQNTTLSCGHDPKPQASCITYFNDKQHSGSVSVRDCEFSVGFYQHGIIIINSDRTVVKNNVISVRNRPNNLSVINRLSADNRTRNAFINLLMSNFSEQPNSNTNDSVGFRNINLNFRTNPDLRNANFWENYITNNPPESEPRNSNELRSHLERSVALELVRGSLENNVLADFVAAIEVEDPSVAYQGIVIGGETATEVHIGRNHIKGFLQGIHVGLSHSDPSRTEYDTINSARIENNYVRNILPILLTEGRHGIFVGNCQRLFIDSNELELQRMSRARQVRIEGIRVWGHIGRKGTITNNEIYSLTTAANSYNTGIKVEKLNVIDRVLHWNVTWNSIMAMNRKLDLPPNMFSKYLDTNQ